MKPILIVMVGLQCSGKSTKAKHIASGIQATILSSDKIREEYKNANNDTVFRLLYERMNDLLEKGIDVIIDATNITIKARKQIFQNLKVDCDKYCHIMNTPYEECLKRLKARNKTDYPHKFDADVIKRYYYSFEIPFYEEGWDNISIENQPLNKKSCLYASKLLTKADGFNQQNKHHTQDLGLHMQTVGSRLEDKTKDLNVITAGYYHDVGKLFTQTFRDGDPNAHYYNHANVGTYELLCKSGCYDIEHKNDISITRYNIKNTLEWLFYINYHMHLFNVQTEKSEKKWRGIFGDEKFNNLRLFNECDKAR